VNDPLPFYSEARRQSIIAVIGYGCTVRSTNHRYREMLLQLHARLTQRPAMPTPDPTRSTSLRLQSMHGTINNLHEATCG